VKTDTKYFGEIEYDEDDLLKFSKGLFGFEEEKSFLLIPFLGNGTLFSLQSIATPQLSFVAMDPFSLDEHYNPVLQPEELEALGVKDSQELGYYTLCAVKEPVSETTVNFKCPVAVNVRTRAAMQVILETEEYHMRHRLGDFGGKKGEASC